MAGSKKLQSSTCGRTIVVKRKVLQGQNCATLPPAKPVATQVLAKGANKNDLLCDLLGNCQSDSMEGTGFKPASFGFRRLRTPLFETVAAWVILDCRGSRFVMLVMVCWLMIACVRSFLREMHATALWTLKA